MADFLLPPDIESLLGYDISPKPPDDDADASQLLSPAPSIVSRPSIVVPTLRAAPKPAAKASGDTICACVALHFECDPSFCPRKGAGEPAWPLAVRVADIQECMKRGCKLCATVYGAIYNPEIEQVWDKAGAFRNRPSKGLLVEFLNSYGHVRIQKSVFVLTRDGYIQPFDRCNALKRLRAQARICASPESIEDLRTWFNECQNHTGCPSMAPQLLPTRLLDLGRDPQKLEVRLFYPDHGAVGYYTALSHCWGEDMQCKTSKANIKARIASIDNIELPRTFHDAALITKAMGMQYMWVDALCIVQDDPRDWEVEAGRMNLVYQWSTLTIAASRSRNSVGGCYVRPDDLRGIAKPRPVTALDKQAGLGHGVSISPQPQHGSFNNRVLLSGSLDPSNPDFPEPLLTRGWAVQERVLSPRIVHFASTELIWECASTFRCQCGGLQTMREDDGYRPLRLPAAAAQPEYDGDSSLPQYTVQLWYRLVEMYSYRRLAYLSDRLPALSGLAHAFIDRGLTMYSAGHWSEDLWLSLIWRPIQGELAPRPRPAIAPSWSWASVRTPVDFPGLKSADDDDPGVRQRPRIAILSHDCTRTTLDECGRVSTGELVVEGRLAPAHVDSHSLYETGRTNLVHNSAVLQFKADTVRDELFRNLRELYCLLWSSWEGRDPPNSRVSYVLVLAREWSAKTEVETYTRVGMLHVDDAPTEERLDSFFSGTPTTRLRII